MGYMGLSYELKGTLKLFFLSYFDSVRKIFIMSIYLHSPQCTLHITSIQYSPTSKAINPVNGDSD
jgi:hypothetical protein